jgi:hypothetical protein
MIVRIPANYRVSSKWIGNMDAVSAALTGGGFVIALSVFLGRAPILLKIPEIALSLAAGVFFGLVRYPLDMHGDRMTAWLVRLLAFLRRDRVGSLFAGPEAGPRREPSPRRERGRKKEEG